MRNETRQNLSTNLERMNKKLFSDIRNNFMKQTKKPIDKYDIIKKLINKVSSYAEFFKKKYLIRTNTK